MRILHLADLHLRMERYHPRNLSCDGSIITLVEVRDGIHCHHQKGT